MNLEVGMYVRTDGGIAKIDKIETDSFSTPAYHLDIEDEGFYYGYAWFDGLKASHNIIDLIEVGDYVNGSRVEIIYDDNEKYLGYKIGNIYLRLGTFDIKSIVTKEEFESIKYSLEVDYEKNI